MHQAANAARVRIIVADDHPLYRDGVARALSARPEFEVIGQAEDGPGALELLHHSDADVAVLDVEMPGLRGTEVLSELQREHSDTRVVLLSAHVEARMVYDAVAAGAGAYLSKESSHASICDAVAQVARGETVLAPEIQAGLVQAVRTREAGTGVQLTPREREVLMLTADGHSAAQVAKELFVSMSTVKTHLRAVYEKLEVTDRAAAVAEAMRRGIIT